VLQAMDLAPLHRQSSLRPSPNYSPTQKTD
jgi:hypothetical protein